MALGFVFFFFSISLREETLLLERFRWDSREPQYPIERKYLWDQIIVIPSIAIFLPQILAT